MSKIDQSKEWEIKKAIRDMVTKNPVISILQIQRDLYNKGYTLTTAERIDRNYIARLIKKMRGEAIRDVDDSKINERIAESRERFNLSIQMLFKIAFWQWEFLNEGIMLPSAAERIAAANQIVKLDLALLDAEMAAGIYAKHLGIVDGEAHRYAPLSEETLANILAGFARIGVGPHAARPEPISYKVREMETVEAKKENGNEQPAQPAARILHAAPAHSDDDLGGYTPPVPGSAV